MKKLIIFISLIVSFNTLAAVELTNKGKITGYHTGWGSAGVRVTIEGATYTQGGCSTKDGYFTMKETPSSGSFSGYETDIAALLAAYMSGKPVILAIDGCIGNRPKIIGVSIYPN